MMPPWWRKDDRWWVAAFTAAAVIEYTCRGVVDSLRADPFTKDATGYAISGLDDLLRLQNRSDRAVLDMALHRGVIGPGTVWP